MRIGIVVKDFPPDVIGGMELQSERMADVLSKRGHDVTVFTKRYSSHDDTTYSYDVVRVPNLRLNPFVSTLTFLIMCLFAVLRRRRQIDCLQCMMIYPVGFLGYLVERIASVPYFAWVRGGDYYLMRDVGWKRWMMRQVLTDTLVLVQAPDIRDDILADFDDITADAELEVLGNGLDVPESTASGDSVLYVGRLAPKKGLEHLLEAMDRLDESGLSTRLRIVGNGSERDRLERYAADLDINVTFEGQVPPGMVDEYYSNAAVFVLPSIEGEGLPNAVLEAMSWGLPVVVTTSGGLPTLVDDGETGYVVPMRDPDALADRIERLLSNPDLQERMGSDAREYVTENHSWDRIANQLESIYQRISGPSE